jgi:hypothetical protein
MEIHFVPQGGTAFCIIAQAEQVRQARITGCLGSFLATIGVSEEQNFGRIYFAWRNEPLTSSLIWAGNAAWSFVVFVW